MNWPRGVTSAGAHCGIKAGEVPDVGLIVCEGAARWSGSFTRNGAAAAPVTWSRSLRGKPVSALLVNSGNANACTGPAGDATVIESVTAVARYVGCSKEEVLCASTGPIGVHLDAELLAAALPGLIDDLDGAVDPFASSILTTDTRTKLARAEVGDTAIVGVAKGAAMCAPNMATMLAFIATDADVGQTSLDGPLVAAVEESFNRISVDGCESTNDSVFLLATGAVKDVDQNAFALGLNEVCASLAEQIVRDAEGGNRLVRVQVDGAADSVSAAALARAVADSALWRAAIHGADPNWGRVLAAFGTVDRELDLDQVSLSIGSELLFDHGSPAGSLQAAAKVMDADEFVLQCTVGTGPGGAEVLTTDLSPEYVTLNAQGTS